MEDKSLTLYKPAAETIKAAILQGQYEAAKGVNRIQLTMYFGIGKYVSLNTRKGVWGTGALEAISHILRKELPGLKGYSATNLKNMRLFYEAWQMLDAKSPAATDKLSTNAIAEADSTKTQVIINSSDASDEFKRLDIFHNFQIPVTNDFPVEDFFQVPFSHHIEIFKLTELSERYYYIHRVSEEHLSLDNLKRLIKDDAFGSHHQMPNNFLNTIPNTDTMRKAVMMFKDSYLLDFINVEQIGEREAIDVDERVVEQQIVQNIKQFIMTFGRDFTFVGNQYHLEVCGIEHFPDLLFFNRELNALVVVELKTGKFKTSYLGQLMGYLSILDAKVKKPHENPSIGIVLCKEANREYVEFVIRDYNKPMGVSTYRTTTDMPEELRKTLPDVEELKKLL